MHSPGRRHWSAAVPLLTLAALFGMHGLGDHTGAHAAEVGAHHAMAMATPMTPASAGAGTPTAVPLDDAATHGATIVCLGVLLGAALALTAIARAARRTGWTLPLLTRGPAPRPHCRDPDPPSLVALEVCRC